MLKWLLGKNTPDFDYRDTLFGDMSVPDWLPPNAKEARRDPWKSFSNARKAAVRGDKAGACEELRHILTMDDLHSRHYLQAWHFLRLLGAPAEGDDAARLYGAVVELHSKRGHDILAVYVDGEARYQHFGGRVHACQEPSDEIRERGARLIACARPLIEKVGAYPAKHPEPPPEGSARITVLTAGGLHFGQGTHDELTSSPLGKQVIEQATELVAIIVEQVPSREV